MGVACASCATGRSPSSLAAQGPHLLPGAADAGGRRRVLAEAADRGMPSPALSGLTFFEALRCRKADPVGSLLPSDRVAEDGCQFLAAGNILAAHAHDARTAGERPRRDLIHDAIGFGIVPVDESDRAALLVDISWNG